MMLRRSENGSFGGRKLWKRMRRGCEERGGGGGAGAGGVQKIVCEVGGVGGYGKTMIMYRTGEPQRKDSSVEQVGSKENHGNSRRCNHLE